MSLLQSSGRQVVQQDSSASGDFTVLSSPQPRGETKQVLLTFDDTARADVIRNVLVASRANIVGGPGSKGGYLVEIPVPVGQNDRQLLTTIQQMNGVKHVTLIGPSP
jgi:hypothetical protein